jgi:hypothetical protein
MLFSHKKESSTKPAYEVLDDNFMANYMPSKFASIMPHSLTNDIARDKIYTGLAEANTATLKHFERIGKVFYSGAVAL